MLATPKLQVKKLRLREATGPVRGQDLSPVLASLQLTLVQLRCRSGPFPRRCSGSPFSVHWQGAGNMKKNHQQMGSGCVGCVVVFSFRSLANQPGPIAGQMEMAEGQYHGCPACLGVGGLGERPSTQRGQVCPTSVSDAVSEDAPTSCTLCPET